MRAFDKEDEGNKNHNDKKYNLGRTTITIIAATGPTTISPPIHYIHDQYTEIPIQMPSSNDTKLGPHFTLP